MIKVVKVSRRVCGPWRIARVSYSSVVNGVMSGKEMGQVRGEMCHYCMG